MSINDNKLVRLISTFSAEDWKKFNYYLKSPYFVRGRDYTVFYNYLYKAYKSSGKFDSDILGKTVNKILSNENIDSTTLQSRMYELTSITVNFLKQKFSEKNELAKNYYFMEFLADNLLFKEFDSVYGVDFDNLVTSGKSIYEIQLISNIVPFKIRNELIQKKYDSAFALFHKRGLLDIAMILHSICYEAIENHKLKRLNVEQSFNPINDILKNIGLEKIMKEIIEINAPIYSRVIMYYYLYEIVVNNKDKEYLSKLEALYFNPKNKLAYDLNGYFSILIKEYYQAKINEGDTRHVKQLFRLYKNELVDGKLPRTIILHREKIFDNHVAIGLRAKDYDFVRHFIENNIGSLPKDRREEVYMLSMVRMYFSSGEYRKALEVTERSKKRKINSGLILRFKMRILYELAMTEEAFLEVDRLKHYVKSNKNMRTDEKKKMTLFLTHYLKLLKLCTSPEHKTYEDFTMGLNKSKVLIPSVEWLREKAEEFKKK